VRFAGGDLLGLAEDGTGWNVRCTVVRHRGDVMLGCGCGQVMAPGRARVRRGVTGMPDRLPLCGW
jgi:hypothetical protein